MPVSPSSCARARRAPLQVIVDGTNSNTALIALGYLNHVVEQFASDYTADLVRRGIAASRGPPGRIVQIGVEQRPWYNPDLNGRWFFVPGVVGTLTLVLVVSLTASPSCASARSARSSRSW